MNLAEFILNTKIFFSNSLGCACRTLLGWILLVACKSKFIKVYAVMPKKEISFWYTLGKKREKYFESYYDLLI